MRRLASSALLGAGILMTGCGAATARGTSPAVTSPTVLASTTTTTNQLPPTTTATTLAPTTSSMPTTTTSTTPPAARFSSITSDLQRLVRFGALPGTAAVPDAVVSCPTITVETGNYFACDVVSATIGRAQFLGKITNAQVGTFQAIQIGPDLTCSTFSSIELLAIRTIGGCAPALPYCRRSRSTVST